jgi:hypothetical protein
MSGILPPVDLTTSELAFFSKRGYDPCLCIVKMHTTNLLIEFNKSQSITAQSSFEVDKQINQRTG